MSHVRETKYWPSFEIVLTGGGAAKVIVTKEDGSAGQYDYVTEEEIAKWVNDWMCGLPIKRLLPKKSSGRKPNKDVQPTP